MSQIDEYVGKKKSPNFATGNEFVGREEEIRVLKDWLKSENSIYIHAKPRSGKTSLLKKLESEKIGFFINASSYNPQWTLQENALKFKMQFAGKNKVILVDEADSAFRNIHLMHILKGLFERGFKIIWSGVTNEKVPDLYPSLQATKTLNLTSYS